MRLFCNKSEFFCQFFLFCSFCFYELHLIRSKWLNDFDRFRPNHPFFIRLFFCPPFWLGQVHFYFTPNFVLLFQWNYFFFRSFTARSPAIVFAKLETIIASPFPVSTIAFRGGKLEIDLFQIWFSRSLRMNEPDFNLVGEQCKTICWIMKFNLHASENAQIKWKQHTFYTLYLI